jgi:hypothetical protein
MKELQVTPMCAVPANGTRDAEAERVADGITYWSWRSEKG